MMACKHKNEDLHPGRIDGTRTVCLECKHPVIVTPFLYTSGKTQEEQYREMLKKLAEGDADE